MKVVNQNGVMVFDMSGHEIPLIGTMSIDGAPVINGYFKGDVHQSYTGEIELYTKTQHDIIRRLTHILSSMGAQSDLISILGSWGDTMPDESILQMLNEFDENQYKLVYAANIGK